MVLLHLRELDGQYFACQLLFGGVRVPNIKSAKKRVLISKANYERNKAYRSALRTAIKKADAAIDAKSGDMAAIVDAAVQSIDKAASKGIIHKNNAARKKSAIVTRFNKANA